MKCINCKIGISSKSGDPICVTCRFDPQVMISLTDARLKYKLTDEEINKAHLFKINFVCHRNFATKFLRSEINELAKTLTNDLDNSNKKKQAFNKQNKSVVEYENKIKNKMFRIETITNICTDLLVKYSIEQNTEITKFMTNLINEDESDVDEFKTALAIIDKVDKLYKMLLHKQNRKIDLDNMIKNTFTDKYLNLAYEHSEYKLFDDNDKDTILVFNQIKTDIMRINNLDNLIKQNIDKKYIEYAFNHNTYHIHLHNNNMKVESVYNLIEKEVCRKKDLDNLIENGIDKKYINSAYNHNSYKYYLHDKKTKMDVTYNIIKTSIDIQINKDNREKELKAALRKKKIKLQNGASTKAYFEYIQSNIYGLDKAINNIINEIDCLKRKGELDKILLTKTSKFYNNIQTHEYYKKYINGEETLENTLREIDKIIKSMEIQAQSQTQKQLEQKRLNILKGLIGNIDNHWRNEYLSLPISHQYMNTGLPTPKEVKKEYIKKKYEFINGMEIECR